MRITVTTADITAQDVDAVVNAANSSLMGGGGVDGAIHRAAGPELLDHCKRLRDTDWPDGLPTGRAAATPAGDLSARYVIHTVGPNKNAGETDPSLLESCFRNSLEQAVELDVGSVAFPAVGAGIFGWDAAEVADAAHRALTSQSQRWEPLEEVRFVLFSSEITAAFEQRFPDVRPTD